MTLKHLLVSALALIATPSIFAQATGAPARGYRGFVDVNILPGSLKESDSNLTYDYNRVGILTTHGFQLNQRIFVGLGLGFEEYTDDSLIEDFNTIIPIYAA
ncbi:hypothetical protein NP234_23915, partial [Salmonella enterica]|nr:hypothetical protein [Salmonella enterica]